MKWILLSFFILIILLVMANMMMAIQSKYAPDTLGLNAMNQLQACPSSPNCVCSEAHSQGDELHFIDAIELESISWQQLRKAVIEQGGEIEVLNESYIHATFTSSLFGYVDDVEFRLDHVHRRIQVRSSSRVGRSDFGVNRKRIKNLKKVFSD